MGAFTYIHFSYIHNNIYLVCFVLPSSFTKQFCIDNYKHLNTANIWIGRKLLILFLIHTITGIAKQLCNKVLHACLSVYQMEKYFIEQINILRQWQAKFISYQMLSFVVVRSGGNLKIYGVQLCQCLRLMQCINIQDKCIAFKD